MKRMVQPVVSVNGMSSYDLLEGVAGGKLRYDTIAMLSTP